MTDTSPVEISYEEPVPVPIEEDIRIERIFGGFPRVTATPTWKPKSFSESFALNTQTGTIYYYDLTNNAWKATGGGSYGGIVAASAASSTLPTGWTVAFNANVFTVTHNLGTTGYTVVPKPVGTISPLLLQYSFSANSFQVQFCSTGGVAGDTAWLFTLVLIT